jgi:oxygen-independent coproporphyrinogen-3 oxidase
MKENFKNLYIHFPFCETKCHYCDFYSLPESKFSNLDRKKIYNLILKELKFFSPQISKVETLFLGGGTPSLVPIDILGALFNEISFSHDPEITIEVNPSSITLEKASCWRKLGINRISLGVQALNDERLKWLSRVHDKKSILKALEILHEINFLNISIDYIIGVPSLTIKDIEEELNFITKKFPNITHISSYLLTLNKNNEHYQSLPNDETQFEQLLETKKILENLNFIQYEISNYYKNNKASKHNQNYWDLGSYLGLGPSAHSFYANQNLRAKNYSSLSLYEQTIENQKNAHEWEETLTIEQQKIEMIMLSLRQTKGLIREKYLKKFNEDLVTKKIHWIETLKKQGLCDYDETKLWLTPKGLFLSESIYPKLI